MICPNCHNDNRAGAKFCDNCGQLLKIICPNCETANRPGAKFCDNCGHNLGLQEGAVPAARDQSPIQRFIPRDFAAKLEAARGSGTMEGERRIVTILFCDVKGSTAAAERFDPEEWTGIMNGAFERMITPVYRYEGTVAQLTGDGLLAFFGAPIAHEDDPQRAALAGLDIIASIKLYREEVWRTWGIDLNVRMGINTGLVVVGAMGSDLHLEYTALGDAINLAARMEQTAEPGTVQVSEETYRLVAPFFEFEPLGEVAIKGKAEPVRVYRLLGEKGVRTRFAVAAEHGFTPYVGRERELGLLKEVFELVKKRRGQVVFISGEAGIGKSRILTEFRRSIQEEAVLWLEGQCIGYRQHTPYRPLIDILKQAFAIRADDDEARVIQRVDKATAGWEEATRETVPYLKFLLSVDPGDPEIIAMDPRARRSGIFNGLRALLLQETLAQPLILVIEDLHWLDEQSEAALVALVDAVATAPVLLLLTYRPGYTHSLGERSYFNHLLLGDLKPEESAALAQGALHGAEMPRELGDLIADKGEGNPFYIEEVIRALLESGTLQEQNGVYELTGPVEKIRVPNTVQEVILSRIDRLAEEARSALQLASVIGREFTAQLLNRISNLETRLEEILEELKFLELIYQKAYFPEQAYIFKHALTQSVAYSTLLRERRKTLHRLIGGAIEELYGDRLTDQYEVLAYHFEEGEDWEKALNYLISAGDKARLVFADQDAREFYTRALAVCDQLGDVALATSADILQRRGWVQDSLENSAADFDGMYKTARKLGDRHLEAKALAYRGRVEFFQHDLEAAEKNLESALDMAGESSDDVRFLANSYLVNLYLNFDRHAEAKVCFGAAEALAPRIDDSINLNEWSAIGTLAYNWEGEFKNALNHNIRWRDKTTRYSSDYFNQLWSEALALGGKGDYGRALTLLEDLIATAKRIYPEDPPSPQVLNTMGWIYGELQDIQQATYWNRQSVQAARQLELNSPEAESNARLNLGDNLLAQGRLNEAERHFQHVEEIVRNPWPEARWMIWRYSQHLFHSYGELWLVRGDSHKALSYADECLELAEKSNSRKNIIKGRRLRGQALMAQGKLDKAERELDVALIMAQKVGNPPQLWKTHAALGDLSLAQERPGEAHQSYGAAMAVIDEVAINLSDESLRETFLNSEHVQGIRQKMDKASGTKR